VNSGQPIVVKAVALSSNAITILPSGADTIDGGSNFVMTPSSVLNSLLFISDGNSNWMLASSYP
jgi:hypothetical protein